MEKTFCSLYLFTKWIRSHTVQIGGVAMQHFGVVRLFFPRQFFFCRPETRSATTSGRRLRWRWPRNDGHPGTFPVMALVRRRRFHQTCYDRQTGLEGAASLGVAVNVLRSLSWIFTFFLCRVLNQGASKTVLKIATGC